MYICVSVAHCTNVAFRDLGFYAHINSQSTNKWLWSLWVLSNNTLTMRNERPSHYDCLFVGVCNTTIDDFWGAPEPYKTGRRLEAGGWIATAGHSFTHASTVCMA